jgi:hypothetical protein
LLRHRAQGNFVAGFGVQLQLEVVAVGVKAQLELAAVAGTGLGGVLPRLGGELAGRLRGRELRESRGVA